MSLSEQIVRTRESIPTPNDFLLYRETFKGIQVWIVAVFDIRHNVSRFVFLTRADASQALWNELGEPFGLPIIYVL